MELETIVGPPRRIAKTLGIAPPYLAQISGLFSLLNLGLDEETTESLVQEHSQLNERNAQFRPYALHTEHAST